MIPNKLRAKGKNLISFGAPGTGKSFSMKKLIKGVFEENGLSISKEDLNDLPENVAIRTTFHPDSDYSTFVGCYKPQQSEKKGSEDQIVYKYSAQSFVNAYINAWCTTKPYFLIIEEINRGNCAQIFGDIFQILDRKPDGSAEYAITPEKDLQKYIRETFAEKLGKMQYAEVLALDIDKTIQNGSRMYLPKNMTILATMNTSDQSLFPMDSAFKRRWEWKYMSITPGKRRRIIKIDDDTEYSWWDFILKVNVRIYKVTQSEDKQLGYWFVKVENDEPITADAFVSKVVFYLWSDVFKDYGKATGTPFAVSKDQSENNTEKQTLTYQSFFDKDGSINKDVIKCFLGEKGLNVMKDVHPDDIPAENEDIDEDSDDNHEELEQPSSEEISEVETILANIRNKRDRRDPKQDYTAKNVIAKFPYAEPPIASPDKAGMKDVLTFIINTIGSDILNFQNLPSGGAGTLALIEKGTKDDLNDKARLQSKNYKYVAKQLGGDLSDYCLVTNKSGNDMVDLMYNLLHCVTKKKYIFTLSDSIEDDRKKAAQETRENNRLSGR